MQRRQLLFTLLSAPLLAALLPAAHASSRLNEPIVGLPCEGCEAVFDGKPEVPSSRARIAPADEPGEPMTLTGRVVDQSGRPHEGVIVYAYQTDHTGIYPVPRGSISEAARRHGRLRAWVQTDAQGEYRFHTIRPGSYPGRDVPEHIHLHVIEPGRVTYYIDDVMFSDDPKLTPRQVQQASRGRGGLGIATPQRREEVWLVRRDIVLGKGIPGYPSRP